MYSVIRRSIMKRYIAVIALLISLTAVSGVYAYGPEDKSVGLGISVGEPTGATVKFWTGDISAINASVGRSYFGAPRVQLDLLWSIDAFNSDIMKLYAGPGLALGIGNGSNGALYSTTYAPFSARGTNNLGWGVRGVLGLNFIPRATPLEIFAEGGLLVGFSQASGTGVDAALGLRFYP
jgi:hypothetical protein